MAVFKHISHINFLKTALLAGLVFAIFFPLESSANLTAVCSVRPFSVGVGEQAVWTVTTSGGTGDYEYIWSGTDDLSGLSQSVSKIYYTPGTKTAMVTVFSDGKTVTPVCELQVLEPRQTLSATCFAPSSIMRISQTVEWKAQAVGGTGNYSYSWIGSESLRGNSQNVSKNYDSLGIKEAIVNVTSGNQSTLRSCRVEIQEDPLLLGQCYSDFSSAKAGDPVTWTALASGGTGFYEYIWSGSENLGGNGQAISKVYETLGTKSATVVIISGSQTIVRNCSMEVSSFSESFDRGPFKDEPLSEEPIGDFGEQKKESEPGNFFARSIRVVATIVLIIGAGIILAIIIYTRKQAKGLRKDFSFAYVDREDSAEKTVTETIQAIASGKQVLISADALKEISKKSDNDLSRAIGHLNAIIGEIKKMPLPTIEGEERWPAIDKETVEKYFLKTDNK